MTPNPWLRLSGALCLICLAIAGFMLGAVLRGRQKLKPVPVATVSFLELSAGDSTVIRTPEGRFIVIDTGAATAGNAVPDALKHMGAAQIDLLVLAAPGDDAVGGVPALLASGIPIRSVWLNSVKDPGDEEIAAVDRLRNAHVPLRVVHENEQEQIGNGPMQFTVVWPPRHGDRAFRDNLVCRLDYGTPPFNQSVLFLGALDSTSEPYLISGAADKLHANVIQVTEHGDGEGTELELLRQAQPEIAVISSTPQSPPSPAALERLQAGGADIWRTDAQGTVTVTLSMSPNTPVVTGSRL